MAGGKASRCRVRLHGVGGDRSVVLPGEWLDRHQIGDEADIVLTDTGISVEPHAREIVGMEDEPELAVFLNLLLADALGQPGALVDPTDLLAEADALLEGVDSGSG